MRKSTKLIVEAIGRTKDDIVRVRLTKAQKEAMREAARSEGLTLSSWLLRNGLLALKDS